MSRLNDDWPYDSKTVYLVCEWLRGGAAEDVRAEAIATDIPPEDALAYRLECLGVSGLVREVQEARDAR